MPIFARSDVGLYHITDLLHDLYFPLPRNGYEKKNDTVCIRFVDQEHILQDDRVSEFELEIHAVDRVQIHGEPSACPDPVQFNKFKYAKRHNVLTLHSVHPIKVLFSVKRLHLTLNQLT